MNKKVKIMDLMSKKEETDLRVGKLLPVEGLDLARGRLVATGSGLGGGGRRHAGTRRAGGSRGSRRAGRTRRTLEAGGRGSYAGNEKGVGKENEENENEEN